MSRPVDTSFTGQGSAGFCELAKTFNDRFANFASPATPAQVRAGLGDARNALAQATTAAPAEIKTDMQILSAAIGEFFAALDKVNFDATHLEPGALQKLQAPDFVTSSQRLQAYLKNVCRTG